MGGALTVDGGTNTLLTASSQRSVSLAYGGGIFLLLWEDDRTGVSQIRGTRFNLEGQPVGGAFAISPGTAPQTLPAASFDGSHFVVAWVETPNLEKLMVSRVSASGSLIDAPVSTTSVGAFVTRPSIVHNAGGSYLIWGGWNSTSGVDVYGARFVDGGLLDPVDNVIWRENSYQDDPVATFGNDKRLCVTYAQQNPGSTIRGQCFDGSLAPTLATSFNLGTSNYPIAPSTATDGVTRVSVWSVLNQVDGIHGRSVQADGGLGAPFVLLSPSETPFNDRDRQALPVLAYDGDAFAAAYEVNSPATGTDLHLRRFRADGTQLETIVVANSVEEERFPALAGSTPGRLGIAWTEFDPNDGALRTRFRIHSSAPEGAFCLAPSDCLTGLCGGNRECCPATGCVVSPAEDAGVDAGADAGSGGAGGTGSTDGGEVGDGGAAVNQERAALRVACGCGDAPGVPISLLLVSLVVLLAAGTRSLRRQGRSNDGR